MSVLAQTVSMALLFNIRNTKIGFSRPVVSYTEKNMIPHYHSDDPHGICFHIARVVSTPRNWKVFLMFCGNRMCPPGRVFIHSDVQGPANQQTSFSGRDDECVAHKLPFSGHIVKKFRGPLILQLNIEGLTDSKMNVLHHLATQLEAFVILLQETHCICAEKLVLSNYQLTGFSLSRKHGLATFVHERLK